MGANNFVDKSYEDLFLNNVVPSCIRDTKITYQLRYNILNKYESTFNVHFVGIKEVVVMRNIFTNIDSNQRFQMSRIFWDRPEFRGRVLKSRNTINCPELGFFDPKKKENKVNKQIVISRAARVRLGLRNGFSFSFAY